MADAGPVGTSNKRQNYICWEDYFMAIACLSAQRSKDPDTQVGACIVNKKNRIVGTGYNGMPDGLKDDEMPWGKNDEDKLKHKRLYVCHAEMNAVLNSFDASLEGCTIYTTLFPCNECTKIIIQSGITKVVYLCDKQRGKIETEAARFMLEKRDIKRVEYEPKREKIEINFKVWQRRHKLKELTSELTDGLLEVLKSKFKTVKTDHRLINLYQTDIQSGSREVRIANPLEYQLDDYERYIGLLTEETKILFVGMAPARKPPNGIPFYDSKALDTLLKERPFDFSEYIIKSDPNDTSGSDSGEIFWGSMEHFFNRSSDFFRHCFLVNFCPLIFMNEERTRNISNLQDDPMIEELMGKCDDTFREIVALLKPTLIVPIGRNAESRVEASLKAKDDKLIYVCQPISCFYDEPRTPAAKKIEEWKNEIENCLGYNATWKEVTSKKRVADLKMKNEEGMI